jgi:alkylhydroperoxidase family enzyme
VAWIRTIGEQEAEEELAALYDEMRDARTGRVDNVLAVHSLHPAGLRSHWELYRAAMRGTKGLRAVEREMIAVVVSARNGCHY